MLCKSMYANRFLDCSKTAPINSSPPTWNHSANKNVPRQKLLSSQELNIIQVCIYSKKGEETHQRRSDTTVGYRAIENWSHGAFIPSTLETKRRMDDQQKHLPCLSKRLYKTCPTYVNDSFLKPAVWAKNGIIEDPIKQKEAIQALPALHRVYVCFQ